MQRIKFRGFWLYHRNAQVAQAMVSQIDDFPSFFTPTADRPLIVDCGANIGVSVLEWKYRWPACEILALEPDPHAFALLNHNIETNDIPGVRCVNAAVGNRDGQATFYGDFNPGGDARGNSMDPDWARRDGTGVITVAATRLAPLIDDREVSFLKLDIEGAEQSVLADLGNQLSRVRAIYVEVHETSASVDRNSVVEIQQILRGAGFTVEQEDRRGDRSLPRHLDAWQMRSGARQVQLLAWR